MEDTKLKIVENLYTYDLTTEPMCIGFSDRSGAAIGKVTTNYYGSEMLNTVAMLFADIDIGDVQLKDGCLINSEAPAIAAIKELAQLSQSGFTGDELPPGSFLQDHLNSNPEQAVLGSRWTSGSKFKDELGFRIYRTCGGLRAMCATHRFKPQAVDALLRFMYTDPRYRSLCRVQNVFRARLTPKHWRLSCPDDEDARTCDYVEMIGSEAILPEFDRMVAYHDRVTGAFKKGGYLA